MFDNFKHFIITRLNSFDSISTKVNTINNEDTSNENNLNIRLNLFKKYCIPSINAQTNTNFIWIILTQEKSIELIKNILNETEPLMEYKILTTDDFLLECNEPNSKNIRRYNLNVNGFYISSLVCSEFIRSCLKSNQWCLTTCYDSDDILHSKFVGKIQCAFTREYQNQNDFYIAFENGYAYDETTSKAYYFNSKQNIFSTLCELYSKHPPYTIFKRIHFEPEDPILFYNSEFERPWIQIIHSNNINSKIIKSMIPATINTSGYKHINF